MQSSDTSLVVEKLYLSISGPAGAPRNWQQNDALFAPGAHSYVLHRLPDGTRDAEVLTQDQYRETRQSYFDTNDFYEVEVAHHADVRGNTALVYSEYESRRTADGPAFDRGVNAIMMVRLGGEWRITSISWEAGTIAAGIRARTSA